MEAGEVVRLVECPDGTTKVTQFLVDGEGHMAQADNHAEYRDRQDHDQLRRQNESILVVNQFVPQ